MIFRSALSSALLASAATASVLAAGCASAPPVAEKMMVPPMGTVVTFHRKSSGSLGNFDGQVVWTYSPATWQGQPMIAFGAPQAGVSLHEPGAFGTVAVLNAAGQPQYSFDPPMNYQWPLVVGQSWSSKFTMTMLPSGRKVPMTVDYKVEAWEDVSVPAGNFKAYKLTWSNSMGEVETRWMSPMEGHATIKRHVERPGSHPQGAGVLDAVLLSRVLPAK